jgi:hypothetical protein
MTRTSTASGRARMSRLRLAQALERAEGRIDAALDQYRIGREPWLGGLYVDWGYVARRMAQALRADLPQAPPEVE